MKTIAPILLFLSSCSPPPPDLSALNKELAALRQTVDELRKAQQPKFDSEQAMVDLSTEVRRLRERIGQLPSPAPAAPPVALPAMSPVASIGLNGGVGGTVAGVNDLYWVLTRLAVDGEERVVLAQYQAQANGRGIRLVAVRMLNADLQIIEYGGDKPHVKEIVDELKKMKK